MRTVIAILFAAACVSANKLTQDYMHILNGSEPLNEELIDRIYARFVQEYRQNKVNKFLETDVDRRTIFANKIRAFIQHNTDSSQTWKKGINRYSYWTRQEFKQYYRLVGDNQECSATNRAAPSNATEKILRDMPGHWDWRDFNVVTPVKD